MELMFVLSLLIFKFAGCAPIKPGGASTLWRTQLGTLQTSIESPVSF